jgi:hypothetical protein
MKTIRDIDDFRDLDPFFVSKSGGPHPTCVTPVAELVDQSWMGRGPIKLVSSLGRECALIEQ